MRPASPGSTDTRRADTAAHVLRTVLDHGPLSRTTIARLTGLSPAAITRHYTDLAARGLLREASHAPVAPSGAGRPHVPVDLGTGQVACGVHIAVPGVTLALADLRGRIIAQEHHPHADRDPAAVFAAIRERLPAFTAGHRVLGTGLVTGGWVDPGRGVIVEHPVLGWRDVPAAELLPGATVDGHARALALAEQMFGAERGRRSLVHLFVGNVADAAFLTGGQPHHGPGSAAGTVAHLPLGVPGVACPCGRAGCFQASVEEGALLARSGDRDFPALLARARAGEQDAVALFRERAALVGRAAGMLLDLINPELLVVTEPGAMYLPDCLAIIRAEASRYARSPALVIPSSFPGQVLGMAAVTAALDAVYRRPLAG
ncbi:ROK family transcriptional regulator [Longispora albida]|uniref:ROK family transcriptional regulator n=1 Tax=Longispora albida TaxID=203523 RepID=UPI00036BD983|nr:ROK family transcriptional regulator [Longispora albida]